MGKGASTITNEDLTSVLRDNPEIGILKLDGCAFDSAVLFSV